MCFVSLSKANLCRGVDVRAGHQKLIAIVDLYLMHHKLETAVTQSRVVHARFASKKEIHHLSYENSGVRAGALWPVVQRPGIIFVDSSAQEAVKG